jgi:transposase
MAKYSTDFKVQVAQYHLENGGGWRKTAVHFGLDHGTVRNWCSIYRLHGPEGLTKHSRSYSVEDKLRVLQCMEKENWSTRQTSAFFNIPTPYTVQTWLRRYNEGGADALVNRRRGRAMSKKKKPPLPAGKSVDGMTPEQMRQELEYLRAENAYLKKLEALIQEKRSAPRKKH